MERRFFMSDFEQSLKDHADNFQMVPSKKVWHGIYNDLHPGKRWPSVTMSLLLIFTLVVIGHLNTNNSRKTAYSANKIVKDNKSAVGLKRKNNSTNGQRIVVRKADLDKGSEVFVYSTGQSDNTGSATATTINNNQTSYNQNNNNNQNNNLKEEVRLPAENFKTGNNNPGLTSNDKNFIPGLRPNSNSGGDQIAENLFEKESQLQDNIGSGGIMNPALQEKIVVHVDNPQPTETLTWKKNNINSTESAVSKELAGNKNIDNIISAKKTNTDPNSVRKIAKIRKKRNDKISWVYFAAPVVSSVSFTGKPLKENPGNNFSPSLVINPKEIKVLHNSALGMEAGAQMNYTLNKRLKFTTGAHLTYSGYNIISNEAHPIFAILVLRNPATGSTYSKSFETHYGDGTGQSAVILRNYNWQASIPFGLQYEISGNDKIQFNVAGNLEPSLVLKSKAYILSSDGRNYVSDPSLLRTFNLSSNFGAFATFSSRKFKWQVGPNVRYQWLSTYLRDYTVKEHLIDYGIRIGISR